jgi:hypothetical protein
MCLEEGYVEMTPEKALGRLINLREQLTEKRRVIEGTANGIWMPKEHYSAIIDDLDDLIRSIERGLLSDYTCPNCEAPMEPPDSEDMERRA